MATTLKLKADLTLKILAFDIDNALAAYETRALVVELFEVPIGYTPSTCAIYLQYGGTTIATCTMTANSAIQLSGELDLNTAELLAAFAALTTDTVECLLSIWDVGDRLLLAYGTIDVARNALASSTPGTVTGLGWTIVTVAGVQHIAYYFPDGTLRYQITIIQDGIPTYAWSDDVS